MTHEESTFQHYSDLLSGAEDWAINQVTNTVIELEKENAELRLDKERLDCLERLGEKGTDIFIDRDHPMYAIRIWPKIGPGPQYDGDNLRAAIDSWKKDEEEGMLINQS